MLADSRKGTNPLGDRGTVGLEGVGETYMERMGGREDLWLDKVRRPSEADLAAAGVMNEWRD